MPPEMATPDPAMLTEVELRRWAPATGTGERAVWDALGTSERRIVVARLTNHPACDEALNVHPARDAILRVLDYWRRGQ